VQARGTNRTSLIYSKTFDDGRIEYIERVIETSGKNKPRLVTKTAWVVAPTGVESSLTRVSTPERSGSLPFVNGRVNPSTVSKVVDENGEPMVVYHGTGRDIESFDAGKSGDLQVNGNRTGAWGSYFSPSSKEASIYAEMSGGYQNVVPVTMNLKNPYVMNRFEWGKHTKKSALMDSKEEGRKYAEQVRSEIEEKNHDGIVIRDRGFNDEWVAFNPTQVKSATGNVGAYGQRPITSSEAANMGMTEGDANDAQGKGDMTPMQARLHQNHRVGDSVLGLDIRPADIIQLWSIDTKPAQKGELSISFLLNNARTPTPHLRQGYDADVGWIWRSQTAIHGHVKSTQDD